MKLSPLAARSLALLGLSAAMIVVLSVSCDSSAGDVDSTWQEYKRKFGKVYSPEEDELRKGIFLASVSKVEQFNKYESAKANYTLEINRFSDMTQEEFGRSLGYRGIDPKGSNRNSLKFNPKARRFVNEMLRRQVDVPAFWDWRQSSVPRVSKTIRDQSECGSCWAMGMVGLLEGQQASLLDADLGEIIDLSVQELVDCTGGDSDCGGGWPREAIAYVNDVGGLVPESSYSYVGGNNHGCKVDESERLPFPHMKLIVLRERDELDLKKIVHLYGPVAVTFDASGMSAIPREHLRERVWHAHGLRCVDGTQANHVVLVVGYGTHPTDGDYWLIKNSWGGEEAGDDYFKIARGQNTCRIAESPMIVYIDQD